MAHRKTTGVLILLAIACGAPLVEIRLSRPRPLAAGASRQFAVKVSMQPEEVQPRARVGRPLPRRRGGILVPPRGLATTVLELGPAPAPSSVYDGPSETQALHFDSSGNVSGTCLYWSKPRYVGRTPTYEFTMLACTWDLEGGVVSAVPCPRGGCEYFQSSEVVAPPGIVLVAENPFGTSVGWRFAWAGSSPYATWAEVQAIEVVSGVQTDLVAAGWQLRYAFDVDDGGNIIGYGRLGGYNRGFLMPHEGP